MTVIACKDGIIAADTSNWNGEIWYGGGGGKINRLPCGSLVAFAGWFPVIEEARAWLRAGAPREAKPSRKVEDNCLEAVILRPDRRIWLLSHEWDLYPKNAPFEAAGSHYSFLMGAMHAGASARQAVELAIAHCGHARGEVVSLQL